MATTQAGLLCGIGDDCAVIKKDDRNVLLVTTDSLVEHVHFDLRYFSFIDLGKKALSVNLSDIAAMGGTPLYAFVSLAVPPKVNETNIADFYHGMNQVASEFSVAVAGGDISQSPNYFFINVAVVGEAKKNHVKYRSGAKAGDGIYVSGVLGSAAVGLTFFNKWRRVQNPYIQAIKNPRPRLYLSRILAGLSQVHALIDISDGLVQDLSHILEASRVAARIEYDKVPRAPDFDVTCRSLRINPVDTLLAGGEDYQLLFTMEDSGWETLKKRIEPRKDIRITRIGEILPLKDQKEPGSFVHPHLMILDAKGREITVPAGGWDHFRG